MTAGRRLYLAPQQRHERGVAIARDTRNMNDSAPSYSYATFLDIKFAPLEVGGGAWWRRIQHELMSFGS